ncbi:hypothetical protein ACTHQ6_09350 [Arthrobacter sp. SAFR-179]|uniref:hypothetical protein n=1 Tax=Arthrobacter sp. SAFR-179 TaxID=3387279 RepID=UPI003F7BDC78
MTLFEEPGQNPYLVDLANKVEERISHKSSSLEITSELQKILGPGGEFDGDLIGPYNIWGIISFGFDVRSQLDAFGQNVTWASDHGEQVTAKHDAAHGDSDLEPAD